MPEMTAVHALPVPPAQSGNTPVAAPSAVAAVKPANDESNGGADFAAVLQKQLQRPAKDAGKIDAIDDAVSADALKHDLASADALKRDALTDPAAPPDVTSLLASFAQVMQPLMRPNSQTTPSLLPTTRDSESNTGLIPSNIDETTPLPTINLSTQLTVTADLPVKLETPPAAATTQALFAATDQRPAELAALSTTTPTAAGMESFGDVLANVGNVHGPAPQAQAAVAPATARVDTPVGTHGWDNEVAQKVVWLSNRQESRAELTLTPAHLGKIEITLTTNGDQTNALFVSASPTARDALEQALPRLRELLAEAGITLGQANVNAESSRQDTDDRSRNGRGGRRGDDTVQAANAPTPWIKRGDGLVDTFA